MGAARHILIGEEPLRFPTFQKEQGLLANLAAVLTLVSLEPLNGINDGPFIKVLPDVLLELV